VIHRDLKPSNLLLAPGRGGEIVKVLDFGIAKLMVPEALDNVQLTLDGEVFGTPKYMAPELFIAGEAIDHRADVYALGCIAYELVTGEPPFVGRRLEVMDAHLSKAPVPPGQRNPAVRPELERLILRCLEKNPTRRLQAVHDLHLALDLMAAPRRDRPAPLRSRAARETNEATGGGTSGGETRADAPGASTLPPAPRADDAAAAQLELATMDAAEAVLALGHSDAELIFLLVSVREGEHARARIATEQRDIEERIAQVETSGQQRESDVRFALAELAYQEHTDPELAAAAAPRVRALEAKLAEAAAERDRAVAQLTERGILLATELAEVEEKRGALLAKVGAMVDHALDRFTRDPSLEVHRERLRVLRGRR
jgi:hypothetical protein